MVDWPAEELLAANLEALAQRDAELAQAIEAVEIPAEVEMSPARDGSVSFRIGQGGGRIINISSRSGKIGHPFMTAYCASKHGVVGFTKALAEELMPFNITVNAICPGVVETDMVTDTVKEQVGDKIIKPSQIAELALYLTGDGAGAITGEAINIFGSTKLQLSM